MRIELASGHTVLADDADMELLLPHSWYLSQAGGSDRLYAAARIRGTRLCHALVSLNVVAAKTAPSLVA